MWKGIIKKQNKEEGNKEVIKKQQKKGIWGILIWKIIPGIKKA